MNNGLIEIVNDLYDISARLRSVNGNYRLFYNTELKRYEVRNGGASGVLEFVVPFGELDARTVEYAMYSRVENADEIFGEIEKHNVSLEKAEGTYEG